jgi:hypothetical protein
VLSVPCVAVVCGHTKCTSHGGAVSRTSWFMRAHHEGVCAILVRARMRTLYAARMLVMPGRCGSSACAAGYKHSQSFARWQFVLQIDEQLFESFAPRKLKRALAKSAKLVVASLPTFHGLDLAPVLKLIAVLTMVGCLVGTVVMPQNALLDDAKSTLCGTRRAPRFLLFRARAASHRFRRAQAGRSTGHGARPSLASRFGST